MCAISNRLQLCSCKTKNVYSLKNFWVLHRLVKGKIEMVMGELISPGYNPLIDIVLNENLMVTRRNEGNIFDFDIKLKEKDRFHVALKFQADDYDRNDFGFEFKKEKLSSISYDVFGWEEHHEEFKFGKIINSTK